MLVSELEDIRLQMEMGIDSFIRELGMSVREYQAYGKDDTVNDPIIVLQAQKLKVELEHKNLEIFKKALSSQPTGPFASGKILSHLDKIVQLKNTPDIVTPITIEWHLSNLCNHACPYCTFKKSIRESTHRKDQFPLNLVDGVIADMKEMNVNAVVHSGGGEPLLYPDICRVLTSIKNAKIRQGLVTNGVNISKDEIAKRILATCEWIRFSVDAGTDTIYKKMHGQAQSFERVVADIVSFVRRRRGPTPRIGVSFLLTMSNYTDLLVAAERFGEIGIDYFQVKPIVITAEHRLSSGNIFWKKEIFNQLNALPALAQKGKYDVYTLGFKFVDLITATDRKSFRKCYGHPFYPVIAANGDVYVCCLMLEKKHLCYGTITETIRFKEIWESQQRRIIGESVSVRNCPVNCKLSETNKTLEYVLGTEYQDKSFLN